MVHVETFATVGFLQPILGNLSSIARRNHWLQKPTPCRITLRSQLWGMEETRVLCNHICPVCSFEIDACRKRALQDGLLLRFDTLDQAAAWGISPDQAARRLHVPHDGKLLFGIPACRALCGEIPHLNWLARLTGRPFIGTAAVTLF